MDVCVCASCIKAFKHGIVKLNSVDVRCRMAVEKDLEYIRVGRYESTIFTE